MQPSRNKHIRIFVYVVTIVLLIVAYGLLYPAFRNQLSFNHVAQEAHDVSASFPEKGLSKQYGAYFANNTDNVRSTNRILGNRLSIFGVFEPWSLSKLKNSSKISQVCRENYTPFITWESWSGKGSKKIFELSDIAQGKYDEYIDNFLNNLQSLCPGKPILVRFDHEMEMRPGYGSPWSPWQGKPKEYIAAWRHVVGLAHNYNGLNIRWVWSPNRGDQYIDAYYPGDKFVDYTSITLNHPTITGINYHNFQSFYEPNRLALEKFEKPIIIGEAGYNYIDKYTYKKWINSVFSYVSSDKNIVALVWFNQKLGNVDYSVTLNSYTIGILKNNLNKYVRN